MNTNYFIWSIVAPSQWILLSAVLTIICWRWRVGRVLGIVTAILVVVFGVSPISAWLLSPLEARFAAPALSGDVAGVIVLEGGENAAMSELHSTPHLSEMGTRVTTLLLLAERYPRAQLVHSGEARGAQVARSLVVGSGVALDRVVFDTQSRNTCDSAYKTRELVEPRANERWLLVTSAFHMPRAMACFRAAGWEITPYPTDFRQGPAGWGYQLTENLADLDLAAHEWLGLVYYRLRGYTNELFPGPRAP